MKKFKFLLPLVIICMLLGCTNSNISKEMTSTTNTIGNVKESSTYAIQTTGPTETPVADLDSLGTKKVIWGCGNIENHQKPNEPLTLQNKYENLGASWLLKDDKKVCLTFDEGYENGYTPQILDTLKEKNVKAIFFVTYDFVKDNPALIKRMIKEGHIVGNHTYRHYTMDEVSKEVAEEEIIYLHNYVKENYNYTMSYFRFPKGEFSQRVLGMVNDLGYKSVFWSFAYADWNPDEQMDEEKALKHIIESTHPGEIMLLHAVSKTNANILSKVIEETQKQGYKFTTKL